MEMSRRWPASAMVVAAGLAVAAGAGWYEVAARDTAQTAAGHLTQQREAGLDARVATLTQDLAHANAAAQSLEDQAAQARTAASAARQQVAALDQRLAATQAAAKLHEQHALADADRRIDALTAADASRAGPATRHRPRGISNLSVASVRSDIAPVLPLPGLPRNATGRDFLVAAQQSIRFGRLGEAQASLERAEVRMLNTPAGANARPARRPTVVAVAHALAQLGGHDVHGALVTVDRLLATRPA
jgi:hypothetical protein